MLQLPDDLLVLFATFLINKERKNLRLVNKRLHLWIPLHISRVFISPSYKNIEVFNAIASHPVYRKQVKEIIWDDAQFEKFADDDEVRDITNSEEEWKDKCLFKEMIQDNLGLIDGTEESFLQARLYDFDFSTDELISSNSVTHERYLSLDENFDLYNRLYAEQQAIIEASFDIECFGRGLSSFPALKRITVTSEAYRPTIISPCYPTPLIRSFPIGFNYPGPLPWKCEEPENTGLNVTANDLCNCWRGILLVLEKLAQHESLVPEFVIDAQYEHFGVAFQLFDSPSDNLRNLEILCQRGLRRLDLAIDIFNPFPSAIGLHQLPQGQPRAVLKHAGALEHFTSTLR